MVSDGGEPFGYDGSSGGLRRRFSAGGGQPGKVGSSKGGHYRYPKHEKLRKLAKPKLVKAPKLKAPTNAHGNHHVHKTQPHPRGHQSNHHAPHIQAHIPAALHKLHRHLPVRLSAQVGHALHGTAHPIHHGLGHHPQADGRVHVHSAKQEAQTKRATILSYNSGAGTAVVRFGNTPDSATVTIPVSPVISSAEMTAATMAGVVLWSDWDPGDALITAVL